jgi:hypothetical protein
LLIRRHDEIAQLLGGAEALYRFPDESEMMAKQIRQDRDESARKVPSVPSLEKKGSL